jgi:sugar phosphate isomerase/epimerase
MTDILVQTMSLFLVFEPYEATLDDRIHAALDAGADGVELSNGPAITVWRPSRATARRLRGKTVTVHAELYPRRGVTLDEWADAVAAWPFDVANAVFHADELTPKQLRELAGLPFPVSLENMDPSRDDWRTVGEMRRALPPGAGFTLDVCHAEECGLPVSHFKPLFPPAETHLSVFNDADYYGGEIITSHALTHLRPGDFPHIPHGCPIVVLEGVMPTLSAMEEEIEFVKSKLR